MKDNADKYKPDVAKVLHEMDPARVLERRQHALAKFYSGEKEALSTEVAKVVPSGATMPAADVQPVTKPVAATGAKRGWPVPWKVAGGLALVAALMFGLAVGVLAGRAKEKAAAADAGSVPAMVSAVPAPSVEASGAAPPHAAPSASAVPSSTVSPSAPVPASATVRLPERPHIAPKPAKAAHDPYDDAAVKPLPAVTATSTVAPVAPPPPSKPEIIN